MMGEHFGIRSSLIWAPALWASMLVAVPAHADDLADLKAEAQMLRAQSDLLEQRIEALERRQNGGAAPVASTPVPSAPAPAPEQPVLVRANPGALPPVAVAAAPPPPSFIQSGNFPGSVLIPGTGTSLRLGGYVKLDAIYDANAPEGDEIAPGAIPLHVPGPAGYAANREGQTRLDARQSRLEVETRTPDTAIGPIRTLIQGDFYGGGGGNNITSNAYNFRVRYAWMEVGSFGFGQYMSNFMDPDAQPETVDFNGPTGFIFLRQGQIRYTHALDDRSTVSISAENPQGDFFASNIGTAGAASTNVRDPIPDLVAYYNYKFQDGHVRFSALGRKIQFDDGNPSSAKPSYYGYGIELTGDIHRFYGRDKFIYEIAYGDGIGRYFQDNQTAQIGAASSGLGTPTGTLVSEEAGGGYISYQHWWNDILRSNLAYGFQYDYNAKNGAVYIDPGQNRRIQTIHADIIWSPIQRTNFGLEYIYAERNTTLNQRGEASRFQLSAQYLF